MRRLPLVLAAILSGCEAEPGDPTVQATHTADPTADTAETGAPTDSTASETGTPTDSTAGETGDTGGCAAADLVVEPAAVDFGTVAQDMSGTATVTLRNAGCEALVLTAVGAEGGSESLAVGAPGSVLIPGGSATAVALTWAPQAYGDLTDTLLIESNDPAEPTVRVPVVGHVPSPVLALDPPDVDFGDVRVGQGASPVYVVLSNDGDAPLIVEAPVLDPSEVFGMDLREDLDGPYPRTLDPGEWVYVVVGFAPDAVESYAAMVQIASDDPVSPTTDLTLVGNGV